MIDDFHPRRAPVPPFQTDDWVALGIIVLLMALLWVGVIHAR
jgi:hypothetical protein